MTRINKSKDGIIGPMPKTEPVAIAKPKAKKGFNPTFKAKKTKKND